MQRQDAQRALYGDSPPPRHYVRHGDFVTKYTTSLNGMGALDHPNEASAIRFIKIYTIIFVPAVISSYCDHITLEYVEGQMLRQAWPVLTTDQRANIIIQLRGYIAQLQALSGTHLAA
ncbi:hypothetical protein CMQ_3695 [Grosmannia clavigera kw1407]|uniref:Uncharacterized protein n=1 Tax=Grosmannia clavigera (strain kw1407 / UAMH 11150) TaxID=655863 RepID=F0X8E2_GROCL|nr:uncharacterized protein CMQ_3695 [Grosmannia clavigera kw1407]EFX05626.1 hypothetical protein CMQ_3695 [Grosmannia clavigera kw1407]